MSAEGGAGEVLAALPDRARRVAVLGGGALGRELAARLGDRVDDDRSEAPADAVIETSGNRDSILAALQRVGDLGVVVLAGPDRGRVSLDLYAHLHVRGLTLIGVRPAGPETGDGDSDA